MSYAINTGYNSFPIGSGLDSGYTSQPGPGSSSGWCLTDYPHFSPTSDYGAQEMSGYNYTSPLTDAPSPFGTAFSQRPMYGPYRTDTHRRRSRYAGLVGGFARSLHHISPDSSVSYSISLSSDGDKAYFCMEPGCHYTTKRCTDLKRHTRAKHTRSEALAESGEMIDCPYSNCPSKGLHGFKRKDHVRDHCRRVHGHELPKEMGGTGKRWTPPTEKERKKERRH